MDISIDKRKTDIIYVDKENNHVANNDEVLKLVSTNNKTNVDTYVRIISAAYNLNDTEIAVLKYLIDNDNVSTTLLIPMIVAERINKSRATISRAIDSLRDKHLIYITSSNCVVVVNSIYTNRDNLIKAKFLVIELHPEVTSKGITI